MSQRRRTYGAAAATTCGPGSAVGAGGASVVAAAGHESAGSSHDTGCKESVCVISAAAARFESLVRNARGGGAGATGHDSNFDPCASVVSGLAVPALEVYPDLENIHGETHLSGDSTHSSHLANILADRRSIRGDRGYRLVKASHAVCEGVWHYEVEVVDLPDGANARVGWAQLPAEQQAPCGYDVFSYGLRLRPLTLFHNSHATRARPSRDLKQGETNSTLASTCLPSEAIPAATRGSSRTAHQICAGDVVGVTIVLPGRSKKEARLMESWKWKGKVKYEPARRLLPLPRAGPTSLIFFSLNGILCHHGGDDETGCLETTPSPLVFENLNLGQYYPAVSAFGPALLKVNFGPCFKFNPQNLLSQLLSELNLNLPHVGDSGDGGGGGGATLTKQLEKDRVERKSTAGGFHLNSRSEIIPMSRASELTECVVISEELLKRADEISLKSKRSVSGANGNNNNNNNNTNNFY